MSDLSVVCVDVRVANDRIGTSGTMEGTLDRTEQFQATVGPNGEISQGTAPGASTWILRGCKLR